MTQQTFKYELRYYFNPHRYSVLGTYGNQGLAYGMRRKKNAQFPYTYPIASMKVVPVRSGRGA